MKTRISRFTVHDDDSAPEASIPILKGARTSAGQLPNFLGVLAGSPAALRGYTRFRAELRHGSLPPCTSLAGLAPSSSALASAAAKSATSMSRCTCCGWSWLGHCGGV